jgi:23S rRNA pseudouridine955/2504/2580 synthase
MIIKCDENMENMRLDRFLRKKLKDKSLNTIFEYIRTGKVKINGKKKKENYRLILGDIIEIKYLEENTESFSNKKMPALKINRDKYMKMVFFEDENCLVINKTGDVAVHKGTGNNYGLAEIFKEIYKNENINFANRIDKETKGLILGAKNLKFLRYLTEKIRNNELEKKYIAVVSGIVYEDEFTIENFLETRENKVVISDEKNGKSAKSIIKKIKTIKNKYTVLEIELVTGRKHQIRVQLADMGYPIVGDRKYGDRGTKEELMLLAYYLKFDNQVFRLDYSDFLKLLEKH